MAANQTTTTTANDYVLPAELLASRVLPHFYGHNNARHMTRFETIVNSPTTAAIFPIAGELAASGVAETADLSYTTYSTGGTTLTASEAGLVLGISDMLGQSDIVDLGHYAQQMGEAMANLVTVDILSLATGFGSSVGATGVNLTEANILDGIQTIAATGVTGQLHGSLHTIQWRDLAAAVGGTLTPAGTTGSESVAQVTRAFGADPVQSGGLLNLYGVNWAMTSNVPTANAGADRAGMIVSPMYAIGFLEKWPVRVRYERDESARITEIVLSTAFTVAELLDDAGVGVVTDA